MKAFSQKTLARSFRNIGLAVLLLLCFAILQAVTLYRVGQQGKQAIGSMENEGLPSLLHVAALQENLALYRLASYEWLFVQEGEKARCAARANELHQESLSLLAQLQKLFPTGPVAAQLRTVDQALAETVAVQARIRKLVDADFAAAMKALDVEVPPRIATLNEATTKLAEACYQSSTSQVKNAVNGFATIQSSAFGFGLATIILTIATTALVGLVAYSTRTRMAGILQPLFQGAETVTQTAAQLSNSSAKLSANASSQAASVEETSASVEEIRSMVEKNSEHATAARSLASEAYQAATDGERSMTELAKAMDEIKAASDKTTKIVKSIEEIAFQTNLLALNAAVEAARAGEAGLGFAVVADEVRNLAHRATAAAQETAQSIEEARRRSEHGVLTTQTTATGLHRIVERVGRVDELVEQIARASAEQSRGVAQVNEAMSVIDKSVQTTATEADQSADAANHLNSQANALRTAVADLVQFTAFGAMTPPATVITPAPATPAPKSTLRQKSQPANSTTELDRLDEAMALPRG